MHMLPGFDAEPQPTAPSVPQAVYTCQVCGKEGAPWGKLGTLADCYPYFALIGGKVRFCYFGFVHEECLHQYWPKEIDRAVGLGWLVARPDGEYEVAPQYR